MIIVVPSFSLFHAPVSSVVEIVTKSRPRGK